MATVYTPTHYGPVSVKTTAGTTAIDSLTQGSLDVLVQQPSDQSPAYEGRYTGQYVEVFKGPYARLRELPGGAFRVGHERSYALSTCGLTLVNRFAAPNPGVDIDGNVQSWYIDKVEVRELAPGDHAELKVTYKNYFISSALTPIADPYQDTWTLNWQAYTVNPFAFCKNEAGIPDPIADGYVPDPNATAARAHIEAFERDQHGNKDKYEYSFGDFGQYLVLNDAERKVFEKKIKGVNAQYHYPILTHQTVSKQKISMDLISALSTAYPDTVGNQVDHIMPENFLSTAHCPYHFPTDSSTDTVYQWVKVGDTMQLTKTKTTLTFTRTLTYWGVISADINLYGNTPFDHANLDTCRWKIGEV